MPYGTRADDASACVVQALLDKVLRKFVETGPVALQGSLPSSTPPPCECTLLCLSFERSVLAVRTEARPQWDNRELEDLRRTAHSMKGSSGYLKADALIESSIVLMTAAEVIIHLITEPFSCVGLTDGRHTRVYVHRQLLLAMRVMCQMHWCVACAVCVYLHRDE